MKSLKVLSHNQEETVALGKDLARYLKPGDILCLFGDLGSGKTTFVKGLAEGLKISAKKVNSPTFVLMNFYKGKLPLFHFDFYRLNQEEEIYSIGYDEFLYGSDGVAVIEWAERFGDLIPKSRLNVYLRHKSKNERSIRLSPDGKRYDDLLKKLGHKEYSTK